MSAVRLATVVAVMLVACAGWDNTSPSYAPPPVGGPSPSHYAPPAPFDPGAPPPEEPRGGEVRVAIASVQLLEDCPEPVEADTDRKPMESQAKSRSVEGEAAEGYRQACMQSTVQLAVSSDFRGKFRIETVRVLDPASRRVAGTATLRGPTRWEAGSSTYMAWDGLVVPGTDYKISYKLGNPDLSRAAELVGPTFNAYAGPFILEIDVSVDGARQTVRSSEFSREQLHMVET